MIESVSNVGILCIRCMRRVESRLHYPLLDWSVRKFQACDRYRKSRYSPNTSDVHAVCLCSILSSLSYTLVNLREQTVFRNHDSLILHTIIETTIFCV